MAVTIHNDIMTGELHACARTMTVSECGGGVILQHNQECDRAVTWMTSWMDILKEEK